MERKLKIVILLHDPGERKTPRLLAHGGKVSLEKRDGLTVMLLLPGFCLTPGFGSGLGV